MIRRLSFDWFRNFIFFFFALVLAVTPLPARAVEDSARVYFLQALRSKQEGDLLSAESLFRKAIDLEPQNADFHFELGNLYIEQNHLQGARMELQQVVMISPEYLAAHYNLGLVYRELGMMGEARNQFRRVLELDPLNVKAQLQIGYVYQEEGFFEEARQAFETAREMDLTNPEPQDALEDLGQFEKEARERSTGNLERSFQRSRGFLDQPDSSFFRDPSQPQLGQPSQTTGQEALMQAGSLLLQQFMNRRSKSGDGSGGDSSNG